MIKNFTKFRIAKNFLLLNIILLILSLCIVNISFAEEKEVEDFPWEIFYPAIIKKSIDKDKDRYTKEQGDCNDSDPSINPVATEICDDNKDNDCDGNTDCNDTDCSSNPVCQIPQKWKLPDTGQTQDFTYIFGEDSDYNINPPSYTDNGNGTITDNVTGLMWQKQNERYNWDDAVNFCENLTLADYSDWRLPSKKELMTILDYGTYSPSLNQTFFPDYGISYYWTSNIHAYDPFNAWMVWVLYGTALYDSKGFNHEVRCIRGVNYTTGDFSDNGDGTVTDNMTDLMWQQDEGGSNSWEDAIGYCENLSLGGHTDWRLPNLKELESITDDSSDAPVIDTNYFPNAQRSLYWSSTTFAPMSSYAYYVDFTSGRIYYYAKWVPFYTRCVRSK
jgi:hypothetical protein